MTLNRDRAPAQSLSLTIPFHFDRRMFLTSQTFSRALPGPAFPSIYLSLSPHLSDTSFSPMIPPSQRPSGGGSTQDEALDPPSSSSSGMSDPFQILYLLPLGTAHRRLQAQSLPSQPS